MRKGKDGEGIYTAGIGIGSDSMQEDGNVKG